uniref:Uncharacterized protein C57A7.06-like n=1 Tax=Rhizophora mucronata TaxID=61149 RepID=A0A2P2MUY4_RHIMU
MTTACLWNASSRCRPSPSSSSPACRLVFLLSGDEALLLSPSFH